MGINVTTGPVEVTVNGTTFYLQGDPTNDKPWVTLLNIDINFADEKIRKAAHTSLIEALAELAETPEDAATVRGLTDGTATLKKIATEYVKTVTDFPTQPSKSSKKR